MIYFDSFSPSFRLRIMVYNKYTNAYNGYWSLERTNIFLLPFQVPRYNGLFEICLICSTLVYADTMMDVSRDPLNLWCHVK